MRRRHRQLTDATMVTGQLRRKALRARQSAPLAGCRSRSMTSQQNACEERGGGPSAGAMGWNLESGEQHSMCPDSPQPTAPLGRSRPITGLRACSALLPSLA